MPPAVALLNYISCGLLWRIFCPTGTFRGVFSLHTYSISLISQFIYVPLPSVCLDFGDISSNSDLYIINMHGALYLLVCRVAHLG